MAYQFKIQLKNITKPAVWRRVIVPEKLTFDDFHLVIQVSGDDWNHKIVLEKLVPDDIISPVCLAGKGTCPPEDCGGAWAYENLKIILADPSHEEYADMKEWLGLDEDEGWDANEFDLEEVNQVLRNFVK